MKPQPRFFALLAVGLCLAAAACAAPLFRDYGRMDPDEGVAGMLEGYRVNPALRFYISGSDLYPNALLGLRRDLRLDPRTLWKEVPMDPATLKEIVGNMKTKAFEYRQFPYGFAIRDNKGETIGVWYSILTARTFVRMQEDGSVRIDTPNLDTYEKFDVEREPNP